MNRITRTALAMAIMRASEHARAEDERLADDWLADIMIDSAETADREAVARAMHRTSDRFYAAFTDHVALRTRHIDNFLVRACHDGCRQIVSLAAGLDSRAFRLELPRETTFFEIDQAELFDFKERALAGHDVSPRCARRVVRANLGSSWMTELSGAGFSHSSMTAWVAEGILMYLSQDQAAALLADIHKAGPLGSRLVFDHVSRAMLLTSEFRTLRAPLAEFLGDPETISVMDSPATWLAGQGWTATATDTDELAAASGRIPLGDTAEAAADGPRPRSWFVDAQSVG